MLNMCRNLTIFIDKLANETQIDKTIIQPELCLNITFLI